MKIKSNTLQFRRAMQLTLLATVTASVDLTLAGDELPITIIHAGTLLSVPGKLPRMKQSLVISEGRISQVTDGFISGSSISDNARVIDLSDRFVMPGMMDMHVHLTMKGSMDAEKIETTDSDYAMVAVENARKTLMAGVTTVRDLGASSGEAVVAVRDAINRDAIPGPRILAAGHALSATAGHADLVGVREDHAVLYRSSGVCDGADDCRRAVRAQYKIGADLIKIMATGGGADSNGKQDSAPEMFDDELLSIVNTAHRIGLKVTAHAHGTAGINAALAAGVDSLEHSSYLDERSIELYLKTGAHLVATASLFKYFQGSTLPEQVKRQLAKKATVVKKRFAKAHAAGVTFSMGTDAGISNHGENAEELVAYVDLGMSPMQALITATVNTATLTGLSEELGTLEVGKIADVIAFGTNPLDDINAVRDVRFVMRSGITHRYDVF
jgi:imidazolonepropionase-like amidohydrolase